MMIHQDGANVSGYAWDDETPTEDFDNIGRYSEQFNELRYAWGEVVRITEDTGTTVTITTDDGTLLLTYDTQSGNLVPVVGELTNRQETLWLRTIPVNDIAVTVVVNDNGEPVVLFNRSGYTKFLKAMWESNGELTISEVNDNATLTAIETYAGGLAEITVEDSTDGNFQKYIDSDFDGYYFVTNQDGYITLGTLEVFPTTQPIAVDGAVQVFVDQACTQYASPSATSFYVRLNRAFGFGDYKEYGSRSDTLQFLGIYTPESEYPNDKYRINAYVDYESQDFDNQFNAGQVVNVSGSLRMNGAPKVIFRDE